MTTNVLIASNDGMTKPNLQITNDAKQKPENNKNEKNKGSSKDRSNKSSSSSKKKSSSSKSKDSKSEDSKSKDSKSKDSKSKDRKSKDRKSKDSKNKDSKSKDGKSFKSLKEVEEEQLRTESLANSINANTESHRGKMLEQQNKLNKIRKEHIERFEMMEQMIQTANNKQIINSLKKENKKMEKSIAKTIAKLDGISTNNSSLIANLNSTSISSGNESKKFNGGTMEDYESLEDEKDKLEYETKNTTKEIKKYEKKYTKAANRRVICQQAMNDIQELLLKSGNSTENSKVKKEVEKIIEDCHSNGEMIMCQVQKQ